VKKDICANAESCRKSTTHVELSGTVLDEQKRPIENVVVAVYGETVDSTKTDKNGHYNISFDTL
jgi:protocatechuate 3,4-dioxygenase beta subunit